MKKLLILMVLFISPVFSQGTKIKSAGFTSYNVETLATQVESFIASNKISESDIISIQYSHSLSTSSVSYSVFLLYKSSL